MKKITLFYLLIAGITSFAQMNIDTLAIQDFETSPATPTWNFTGPVIYNSGMSTASSAPANSPIGINASRAWETTQNSGGLVLEFDNVIIPAGYDSIQFEFRLAAMNLGGTSGGPDHLDYVLVEYSTDNGVTYHGRLRIRGAAANNGFWTYSATAEGKVYYQPTSEVMFQPANTGLATTDGYSTNGITFPGSVSQIKIRMTGRSSSSSDTWLVDNVVLRGINTLTTSVDEIDSKTIKLFPNPTSGIVTIDVKNIDSYIVYDVVGNVVKTKSIDSQIDLTNQPNGMYFVQIQTSEGLITKKVIKR